MNDFTKEELEILHSAIEYWIENIALLGSKVSPVIINKIQSMIDNYCEHAWDDAATNQFYCIKCQQHIDKV